MLPSSSSLPLRPQSSQQQQTELPPETTTSSRKRPQSDVAPSFSSSSSTHPNAPEAKRRKVCPAEPVVAAATNTTAATLLLPPVPWPVCTLCVAAYGNEAVTALLNSDALDFYAKRMITLSGGNAAPRQLSQNSAPSPTTSPLSTALSSSYSSPFMARVLNVKSSSTFATIEGDYVKLMSGRTKLSLTKYRAAGLDWSSRFLECLKCSISTFSIVANLFDRFMYRLAGAGICPASVDDLSLSIIVISQLAMLFNEDCRPRVSSKDLPKFVQTSSSKPFSAHELHKREAQVLSLLKFNVHHYPTPRALLGVVSQFLKQGMLFYTTTSSSGHRHHQSLPPSSSSSSSSTAPPSGACNVFSTLQNCVVSSATNADITLCDPTKSASRFDMYCRFLCDLILMQYDYLIIHSPAEIVAVVGYIARWRWATALLDALQQHQPSVQTVPPDAHRFPLRLFDPPWPLCLITILGVSEERLMFMARTAVKPLYQCLKHPYNLIKQYALPEYGGVAKLGIPDFSSLDQPYGVYK